jgi:hypothetical protein
MHHQSHYETVSEAINKLRLEGFVTDFNLQETWIVCDKQRFEADELEIVDVYRYEGDTDPSDEATVYALESKSGVKGILVTGYGASMDIRSVAILEKLKFKIQ